MAIEGVLEQYEEPDWEPLTALVGDDIAGEFMWMHEVRLADGRRVHAYKNIVTRRYVHLSPNREAFVYTAEGTYRSMPLHEAVGAALVVPPVD